MSETASATPINPPTNDAVIYMPPSSSSPPPPSPPPRRPDQKRPPPPNFLIQSIRPLLKLISYFGFEMQPAHLIESSGRRRCPGGLSATATVARILFMAPLFFKLGTLVATMYIYGTALIPSLIMCYPEISYLLFNKNYILVRCLLERISASPALPPGFFVVEGRQIFGSISLLFSYLFIIYTGLILIESKDDYPDSLFILLTVMLCVTFQLFYFAIVALFLILLAMASSVMDWSVRRCTNQPSRANFRQFFQIHQMSCDIAKTLSVAYKHVAIMSLFMMMFFYYMTFSLYSIRFDTKNVCHILPGLLILTQGSAFNFKLRTSMQRVMCHLRMVNKDCPEKAILSKNVESLNQINYMTHYRLNPDLLKIGNSVHIDLRSLLKRWFILRLY